MAPTPRRIIGSRLRPPSRLAGAAVRAVARAVARRLRVPERHAAAYRLHVPVRRVGTGRVHVLGWNVWADRKIGDGRAGAASRVA